MEAIMKLCVDCALKEKLDAISEPKNTILARIQKYFMFNENDGQDCAYSRMHTRHNRS